MRVEREKRKKCDWEIKYDRKGREVGRTECEKRIRIEKMERKEDERREENKRREK